MSDIHVGTTNRELQRPQDLLQTISSQKMFIDNIELLDDILGDENNSGLPIGAEGKTSLIETIIATYERIKNAQFSSDLVAYYGNTKLVDDGQDETLWVGSATTVSADTSDKVLGKQSVTFPTIIGSVSASLNNISLDLTKLNNGEDSPLTDYIVNELGFDDFSVITVLSLRLSSATTFDFANHLTANLTPTKNGFQQLNVEKTNLAAVGSGADLADIQSINILVTATAVTNVNVQYIQLVKKDPTLSIPNPLQRFGVVDFDINSGDWFVGKEFGKIKLKLLNIDTTKTNVLQSLNTYNDFKGSISSTSPGVTSDTAYITLINDDDNQVYAVIINDTLRLTVIESAITVQKTIAFPISDGDKVILSLEKSGQDLVATAYKNGDINNSVSIKNTTILNGLNYAIGANSTIDGVDIEFSSIAEIPFVARAGRADIADSLVEQPYLRVTNSGAQSIPDITLTPLILDTAIVDNRGQLDSSRVYIRETGKYHLNAHIGFVANVTGYRRVAIRLNGTTIIVLDTRLAVSGTTTDCNVSRTIRLSAGDYLELLAGQTSGAPLNTAVNANLNPEFTVERTGG